MISFFPLWSSSSVSALWVSGCIFPLGPFHQVPLFLLLLHCCPLSRPLQHAHTDTQTHPLLISKQAEPMKVNNWSLSWKCPLLLRWSGVGVCIQSKHHHSQIPTCGDLECLAARAEKTLTALALECVGFARKVGSMVSRISLGRGYITCIYVMADYFPTVIKHVVRLENCINKERWQQLCFKLSRKHCRHKKQIAICKHH